MYDKKLLCLLVEIEICIKYYLCSPFLFLLVYFIFLAVVVVGGDGVGTRIWSII